MIDKLLYSREGNILISILWGLGAAAIISHGVVDKIYKGPPVELKDKVWTFGDGKYYKAEHYSVKC